MNTPTQIWLRRSNKGVFHILAKREGITFSFCYMHRHGEHIVRIWNYDTQEKLRDVGLSAGGSFNLDVELTSLVVMEKEKQDKLS
jgi:hypothetical protein